MTKKRKNNFKKRILSSSYALIIIAILFFSYSWFIGEYDLQTSSTTMNIPKEQGSYEVYFCPRDNCTQEVLKRINNSTNISCAFYDIDEPKIITALKNKNAEIIIFEDNYEGYGHKVKSKGLMHNKFCIFDNKLLMTGSMNPTKRGTAYNDNNLFFINSPSLIKNYEDEFEEISSNNSINNPTTYEEITFNNKPIKNYFCPEDGCEEKILSELETAKSSIKFMTFTFTSNPIGNLLLEKWNSGLNVEGVFEKRQKSQWWEFTLLNESGVPVYLDGNPYTMHHKVFIIDDKKVIFGSMNPTASANNKNDENIIISYDPALAKKFLEEYEYVKGEAS